VSVDDEVFKDVCQLLSNNSINYWICHGTLLGIIRENRLLPWDHDIDFAVWDHETEKRHIETLMKEHGYHQEVIPIDMDCLHFFAENKKVDISFYKIDDNIGTVKWAISPTDNLGKLMIFISNILLENNNIIKYVNKNLILNALLSFVRSCTLFFTRIVTDDQKQSFINHALGRINYTGYSYPTEIMKIKMMDYAGIKIPIPIEPEICLEMTYGKDWRIPNKNYIWYEEAENLFDLSK
jgi:hypothetical protein